ncbi:MAG TPA: PLP-dependent aminotransferase family protein [Caldilineaceae bacterium]|nr:PLP-dependent aminotransferase family protein [Caldilineaceae bacterium]
MAKRSTAFALAAIAPDPHAAASLYQQLYNNLRTAILTRRLGPGTKLPATRQLASELGLARNTVVSAFEQLFAEGYLDSRTGDGTYVSHAVPDERLTVSARSATGRAAGHKANPALAQATIAVAGARLGVWSEDSTPQPFRPDMLALDHFPVDIWARLASRRWRNPGIELLGYGDPAGYPPLRAAVAAYLGASRGVRCTADQVLITTGAQLGLDLAIRTLLNPGDQVWVENPGYRGMRGALIALGAAMVPVPVDQEGIQVEEGIALAPTARAVYVTPSHQYPTGAVLSLARRLALLEWAQRTGAWIIEDDYDSEYRYTGRPLSSLQGLDSAERVIYIGTFSKVLFPALRLGYLVLPAGLVEPFKRTRALCDRQAATVDQAVLTDFIEEGHFARHIRRMRQLYADRQTTLVRALHRLAPGWLEVENVEAGLHIVGWLPPGVDDHEVGRLMAAAGLETQLVSRDALTALARGGLLLGFAGLTHEQIEWGVAQLVPVLRGLRIPSQR